MIQKDYIQRMIEAFSKVLGRVIGLDPPAGLEIIEESYRDYLKIEGNWLDDLSEENLLKTLQEEKRFNVAQLEFLAELLAKEGELLHQKGVFLKAKSKLKKALIIFEFVDIEQQLFSFERQTTILKIKELIRS